MKILIDASCLAPPLTGVGRYARNIIERLPAALPDAEFRYFLGGRWAAALPDRARGSFTQAGLLRHLARRIPVSWPLWRGLQAALWRGSLSAEDRGSVCFAPNFLPPCPWTPCVPVVHDLSFLRLPESLPQGRRARLQDLRRHLHRASAIIAVSGFTAKEMVAEYGLRAERIHLAPPGVAPRFWRDAPPPPESLAEFSLSPQGYYLCVGTFEPRKNLATLVAAYSRLPSCMRERFPLVLAGAPGWGNYGWAPSWETLANSGQLRILDYVPDEALADLYGGAIALCMPSLYEGFGMPVAEALAGGTPVLASNAGALPATVGPGGILLSPLDVPAWTDAMIVMAEDDALRRRLAAAGRPHGRSFRWDASALVVAAALRAADPA